MLREQKALGTTAGLRAAEYFERGLLVPDEITIEVVRQWLAEHPGPCALDGYPRTILQAEAFDAMLGGLGAAVDFALLIMAGEPVIRDRVGRRLVFSARACMSLSRPIRARAAGVDWAGGPMIISRRWLDGSPSTRARPGP
jgi:adenylate kinase family enzyme